MTVTPILIAFFVMAVFTLGGGLGVVSSRNLIHSALYLALSLFGMAGLFVLLEAPFFAAIQLLVYLGAISVLITITIMVTRRIADANEAVNRQWPIALVIAVLVAVTFGYIAMTQFAGITPVADVPPDDIETLGMLLADPNGFFVPFEVASVLLLAALIGSIVVARE